MVDADPRADALTEPGTGMVPATPPVAGVEQVGTGRAPLDERG
jgi:hypothetical protein